MTGLIMDVSDRYAILQKIAKVEKQLAALLRQKEETEAELQSLRERLERDGHRNPHEVRGVLSQRLYVEKAGLPSALINQIKRLAAFQNPEFYKKQNLRLSTPLTPRVISCAEDQDKYIVLPRGCLDGARIVLQEYKSHLELEDVRYAGEPIEATFLGKLTEAQLQAVTAMAKHDNGMIVAPPGFGKTVLGTCLVAERKCNTMVLVDRQPLLEQWRSQIGIFLGRDA